ncbi:MAG TPA: septation protein IspZ [Phenylobacterium sp.]
MKNFLYAARPFFDDFLYTIAFLVLVSLHVDVRIATLIVSALGIAHIVSLKLRRRSVSRLQWMGLGLVLVFGGATILTHDVRFILFKPTMIYLAVGAVLAVPGWMSRYMPPAAKGLIPEPLIVAAGFVWSALMFATAGLNLVLALRGDAQLWATVMGVFPMASKLVLFGLQFALFRAVAVRRARARFAAAAA